MRPDNAAAFSLLLLGDGRYPAGGHVHSGGIESAIVDQRVHDEATLEMFVTGRIVTTGLVDAALAAATFHRLASCPPWNAPDVLRDLDAEAASRAPALPLREASRRQGRQLARVAQQCWPGLRLVALTSALPAGALLPIALGTTAVEAGLRMEDAARLVMHHTMTTCAQAAVRLLGLDPYGVAAMTVRLADLAERTAQEALATAAGPLVELPARSAPIFEIAAIEHDEREAAMFAT